MLSLFAAVEALRVPPPMMNQAQAEAAAKAAWLAKTSQPGPLAANNGYVVPTGMAPAHELYEDRVLGSHSGSATQYEYGMEHPSTNWALAPGGMPGVVAAQAAQSRAPGAPSPAQELVKKARMQAELVKKARM